MSIIIPRGRILPTINKNIKFVKEFTLGGKNPSI